MNWLWQTTGIDFRSELDGMSSTRKEAEDVFQAVMADIPASAIERLHELEEQQTGRCHRSTIKALRALYDKSAKEVKREGRASDERIARMRAEAGVAAPEAQAHLESAVPSRKEERRRLAFEKRIQELHAKRGQKRA